jgi:hypothetical protein
MKTFHIFRNAAPFKKLRAKSIEEAIGLVRKTMMTNTTDYFEIKTPEGKLTPVFAPA